MTWRQLVSSVAHRVLRRLLPLILQGMRGQYAVFLVFGYVLLLTAFIVGVHWIVNLQGIDSIVPEWLDNEEVLELPWWLPPLGHPDSQ